MEKESSPLAVEEKYAQRFTVEWIFTTGTPSYMGD